VREAVCGLAPPSPAGRHSTPEEAAAAAAAAAEAARVCAEEPKIFQDPAWSAINNSILSTRWGAGHTPALTTHRALSRC
jgi:hypothetical protein